MNRWRVWGDSERKFLGLFLVPMWDPGRGYPGQPPLPPQSTCGCGRLRVKRDPVNEEGTVPGWACKVIKYNLPTLQMEKWWNREGTWSSLKVIWEVSATPGRLTPSLYFNLAPSIHSLIHSIIQLLIYLLFDLVCHLFLHWFSPLFLSMHPSLSTALICPSTYPFICSYSSFIHSHIH